MTKEIKSVVFDFDGVLVNSVELKYHAMKETFLEFGEEFAEKVLNYHKKFHTTRYLTAEYAQKELKIEDESFVQKYAQKYSYLVEDQIVQMPFYPGAESLLIYLSKIMPIFISTGTPTKEIDQILKKKCSRHLFSNVYGSPEPKEEHFKQIIKQTNIEPEEILFIGDMPSDYKVAKNIGVQFLGYNFYHHESHPEVINIKKILEIKDYINKI